MEVTRWQDVIRSKVAAHDKLTMGKLEAELTLRDVPRARVGTYRSALTNSRRTTPQLFEQLADIVGFSPDEFVEYRLMRARSSLDPEVVGLEAAAEMLEALEAATRSAARAPARRAAARQSSSRPQKRADRPARRTAQGG